MGDVAVQPHIRDKGNGPLPHCARIGHVAFQKGTTVAGRHQPIGIDQVQGPGVRNQHAQAMGHGQRADQPQHDGGRLEDGLARGLGLEEGHGAS